MEINTHRVYGDEAATPSDGYRVFVDRLWPRGESKVKFHYDLWAKDVAPSAELREWFHADPASRWEQFRQRYLAELAASPAAAALAEQLRGKPRVTLLYSSKDTLHNNAEVLAEFLRSRPE